MFRPVAVPRDAATLDVREPVDRLPKPLVGDPVMGHRVHRLEAADELVLALRARVELGQALFDAKIDALVKAGFEVPEAEVLERAPA